MKEIKISQILDDLERGLSRESTSPDYNPELGCIKDKYELTNKELKYLFDHPKLKGKRTKLPVMFTLVDDTVQEISTLTSRELDNNLVDCEMEVSTSTSLTSVQGVLNTIRSQSSQEPVVAQVPVESPQEPITSEESW